MNKILKPFVGNQLPDFITADNPTFGLFIEAYYEFLEKRNDSESTNVKELFKSVDNPGAVVNNITSYKDVDLTLDNFITYFKKEILPISFELPAVKDRFLIKKIRDVYLAKGSPKSFELLFKMLYNEDIDIFETRDNIIEASEGKYLSFPIATFKVVNYSNNLENINFSLAHLTHSDNNYLTDSEVALTLSGQILGKTGDSDKASIISVQLNFSFDVDDDQTYRITDPNDSRIFIEVVPFLSLVDLISTNNAPGYIEGDIISVKSKSLNRTFNVIVDTVNNGPVTGLHFRDRGEFFKQGDSFVFTPNSPGDGSGGLATVTETDKNGRITEVDGYKLRTGILNNGFLSDDFENVIVPIISGGSYNVLPDVSINNSGTINQGLPYSKTPTVAQGPQFSPVSTKIGTIAKLSIFDRGYFADQNDIIIESPMNVTVEGRCEFAQGQLVTFQYLEQSNKAFEKDSDRIDISIKINKTVDSETKYNIKKIRIPFDFDSEIFQWKDSDFVIDSENGLLPISAEWKTLASRHFNYEIVTDSENEFRVRIKNKFVNSLDSYHYNLLNNYNSNDSDYVFSWRTDFRDPKLAIDSEVAVWRNTDYFGIVERISPTGKIASIKSAINRKYPTDSDINHFNDKENRIIRIVAWHPAREEIIIRNKKPLSNIVADHNRAKFRPILNTSGISAKTFINEDGFLNSLSGGVIQDNYFYSFSTYIIQSNLSIDLWRDKIKKTLHPAGLYMFAETNLNQNIKITTNVKTFSSAEKFNTNMTFDTMLDHYSDPKLANRITADNTRYESNSFLFYNQTTLNLNALKASNYENGYDEALVSEYGASWFDFEPMGLVRKEKVNYDGYYNNYLNFDSDTLLRDITTQDSDSTGYVNSLKLNYKKFNSNIQDFYKKESRTRRSYDPVQIASTKFIDPINDLFNVYDSDLPIDIISKWSDSDNSFKATNYDRLKSKSDNRTFKWFNSNRKREMFFAKANDFNTAMRLQNKLIFKEQDGTVYTDFDAFERKWNRINSWRKDSEGWEINGYSSFVQNFKNKPRKLYKIYGNKITQDYQKTKTPFKPIVWDNYDSDNITWNAHYNSPEDAILNNSVGTIFDWFDNNERASNENWRDPNLSMRGRKPK